MPYKELNFLTISGWAFKKESLLPLASQLVDNFQTPVTLMESCALLNNINQIQVAPETIIVGWSMGTLLALELYFKNPEKVVGLVLLSGTAAFCNADKFSGIPHQNVRAMKISLLRSPEKTLNNFMKLVFAPLSPPDNAKEYLTDLSNLSALSAGLDYLLNTDFYNVLYKIKAPTMIVAGEKDNLIPCAASKKLSEQIQNSHFVGIKDIGHILPVVEPKDTSEKILKWLSLWL